MPDAPVFGSPEPLRVHQFSLWVHQSQGPPKLEIFACHDLDMAGLMAVLNATGDAAEAQASMFALEKALVDTDGLSDSYLPPSTEELEEAREEGESIEDAEKRLRDPRYEDEAQGSSRRRFFRIVNDPARTVPVAALKQVADWLAEVSTDFQQAGPPPSSNGASATSHGPKVRRRSPA